MFWFVLFKNFLLSKFLNSGFKEENLAPIMAHFNENNGQYPAMAAVCRALSRNAADAQEQC